MLVRDEVENYCIIERDTYCVIASRDMKLQVNLISAQP